MVRSNGASATPVSVAFLMGLGMSVTLATKGSAVGGGLQGYPWGPERGQMGVAWGPTHTSAPGAWCRSVRHLEP